MFSYYLYINEQKCYTIKKHSVVAILIYLTLGLGEGWGLALGFGKMLRCGLSLMMFCDWLVCMGLASSEWLLMICITGKLGWGVGGFRLGEGDLRQAGDEYGDGG